MILNMISRNTDSFTGFVFQGEEKIYFHAQDKVFNFITEGVGILAEFSKNVMKSPEHFFVRILNGRLSDCFVYRV